MTHKNQLAKILITIIIASFFYTAPAEAKFSDVLSFFTPKKTKNIFLIKTADSPVIYLIVNNKRHKILTPEVFADYSLGSEEIKIITEQQLLAYPKVKLAKTPDNSKVYYLNEVSKKKILIPTPAIFNNKGYKWVEIVTLSQADLDSYSNIKIVKTVNNPTVYVIKNKIKKPIANPQEFLAAGYQWNEIETITEAELANYQNQPTIINNSQQSVNITEQPVQPTIINNLKTELAKINQEIVIPNNVVIPALHLKLTADSDKPIAVNGLKISHAKGLSFIKEIIITDKNQKIIGQQSGDNQDKTVINFPVDVYIAPHSEQILDIAITTTKQNFVNYEQLSIDSVKDIFTTAKVTGVFPLQGDRIKTIPSSNIIGKLKVEPINISDGLVQTHIGVKDQLLTRFSFSETSNNEDINLTKLIITKNNSSDVQLANIDLVNQNNKIISTITKSTDDTLVFDLTKAPYKINKNSKQTLSIRGDVVAGNGGTIKLTIQKPTDISASGVTYGFSLLTENNNDFPLGTGSGNLANKLIITGGSSLLYKNKLSPTRDLIAGGKNQTIGIFDIRIDGQNMIWNGISLQLIQGDNINLDDNLIIREYKKKTILGQIEAKRLTTESVFTYFNRPTEIKAGQTYTFEIVGNIKSATTNSADYQIKINILNFQLSGEPNSYYFNYDITSNVLGIKQASISATANNKFTDKIIAAGKADVLIGSFVLQAGAAENLNLAAFNIQTAENYAPIDFGHGYSNLKIKVNNKDYAVYDQPSGRLFTINKSFVINAGKTATITVYVNTASTVAGDKIKLLITDIIAQGKTSNIDIQLSNEATSAVTEFKAQKLTISKNTAAEEFIIVANKTKQKVASFLVTNQGAENIKIDSFTIVETTDSAEISYTNGYGNLQANGKTAGKPLAAGNIFSGLTIKTGATATIDVYLVPDSSTIGDEFTLMFTDIKTSGNIIIEGAPTVGQPVRVVGN